MIAGSQRCTDTHLRVGPFVNGPNAYLIAVPCNHVPSLNCRRRDGHGSTGLAGENSQDQVIFAGGYRDAGRVTGGIGTGKGPQRRCLVNSGEGHDTNDRKASQIGAEGHLHIVVARWRIIQLPKFNPGIIRLRFRAQEGEGLTVVSDGGHDLKIVIVY